MVSVQEINFYNSLVEKGLTGRINCPFDQDDIVITKVNDKDEVYFKCLSCETVFYPGVKVINIIKNTIDKYKN